MNYVPLTDKQIELIKKLVEDAIETECGDDIGEENNCSHPHMSFVARIHLRDALAERKSA